MESPTLGNIFTKHLGFPAPRGAVLGTEGFADCLVDRVHSFAPETSDPEAWVAHFFDGEHSFEQRDQEFKALGASDQSPAVLEFQLGENEFVVVDDDDEVVVVGDRGSFVLSNTSDLRARLTAAQLPSSGSSPSAAFKGNADRAFFVTQSGKVLQLDAKLVAKAIQSMPAPRVEPLARVVALSHMAAFSPVVRRETTKVRTTFAAETVRSVAKRDLQSTGSPQVVVVEKNTTRQASGEIARFWQRMTTALTAGGRQSANLGRSMPGASAVAIGKQTYAVKAGGVTVLVQRPVQGMGTRADAMVTRSKAREHRNSSSPRWVRDVLAERPAGDGFWIQPAVGQATVGASKPAWVERALSQARDLRMRAREEVRGHADPQRHVNVPGVVAAAGAYSAGGFRRLPRDPLGAALYSSLGTGPSLGATRPGGLPPLTLSDGGSIDFALPELRGASAAGSDAAARPLSMAGALPATTLRALYTGLERSASAEGHRIASFDLDATTRLQAAPAGSTEAFVEARLGAPRLRALDVEHESVTVAPAYFEAPFPSDGGMRVGGDLSDAIDRSMMNTVFAAAGAAWTAATTPVGLAPASWATESRVSASSLAAPSMMTAFGGDRNSWLAAAHVGADGAEVGGTWATPADRRVSVAASSAFQGTRAAAAARRDLGITGLRAHLSVPAPLTSTTVATLPSVISTAMAPASSPVRLSALSWLDWAVTHAPYARAKARGEGLEQSVRAGTESSRATGFSDVHGDAGHASRVGVLASTPGNDLRSAIADDGAESPPSQGSFRGEPTGASRPGVDGRRSSAAVESRSAVSSASLSPEETQTPSASPQGSGTNASGRALLGHEVAHVVQARQSRVRPTLALAGMPLNDFSTVEAESDRLGVHAARAPSAMGVRAQREIARPLTLVTVNEVREPREVAPSAMHGQAASASGVEHVEISVPLHVQMTEARQAASAPTQALIESSPPTVTLVPVISGSTSVDAGGHVVAAHRGANDATKVTATNLARPTGTFSQTVPSVLASPGSPTKAPVTPGVRSSDATPSVRATLTFATASGRVGAASTSGEPSLMSALVETAPTMTTVVAQPPPAAGVVDAAGGKPGSMLGAKAHRKGKDEGPARLEGGVRPGAMPDRSKSGVETLSGTAVDDVKVHSRSSAPGRLGALAYVQGTAVHLAPGAETGVAHEAAQLVQAESAGEKTRGKNRGGGALRFTYPSEPRWWGAKERDLAATEQGGVRGALGGESSGARALLTKRLDAPGASATTHGSLVHGAGSDSGSGSAEAVATAGFGQMSSPAAYGARGARVNGPASTGGHLPAAARAPSAGDYAHVGRTSPTGEMAPHEGEMAYVAVAPTGEARVVGAKAAAQLVSKKKSGMAVDMTVVAGIAPQAPSVEEMALAGHERPHAKGKKEGSGGATGKTDALSLQGTVDSLAQRIYHRLKRRLQSDRERFGG